MAVYTQLSDAQINHFLAQHYDLSLVSVSAINEGTENSNFLLHVTDNKQQQRKLVLTLFESLSDNQQLMNYLDLCKQLQLAGFCVPAALVCKKNQNLHRLADKPCILAPFIEGHHPQLASSKQCTAISTSLAGIHTHPQAQALDFSSADLNTFLSATFEHIAPQLSTDDHALASAELAFYAAHKQQLEALPKGVIHSDLFRDNTLFEEQQLRAILDFYSAERGYFIYDLAVLINDWCFADSQFIAANYHASINGYQNCRKLNKYEIELLPLMLRMAACRFWFSRLSLEQQLLKTNKPLMADKNPLQFKQRLLFHISQPQLG